MVFDISDHFNTDGSINADGPGLATLAGEGHEESKSYADVVDLPSFVKAAFDTHAKVGKKLENVIQKPAADATDEQKAEYRSILNTERGAPKSGSEYELTRIDGITYDDAKEAEFRELLAKGQVPKDTAKILWDWYHNDLAKQVTTAREAEETAEKVEIEKLQTDWQGDKMTVNGRLIYKLLQEIGEELYPDMWEDFTGEGGKVVKGSKSILAELNINDSPGDFEKWAKGGFGTQQLRFLEVLARRIMAGKLLSSEGAQVNEVDAETAFEDACSSKSAMANKS